MGLWFPNSRRKRGLGDADLCLLGISDSPPGCKERPLCSTVVIFLTSVWVFHIQTFGFFTASTCGGVTVAGHALLYSTRDKLL